MKDGKIRPAGTFGHPILAGSYAAGMASVFFGLVLMDRNRAFLPAMGLLTAVIMVFLSASSGPVASLAVAIMCWCLIPFRRNLKQIRIGAVIIKTHTSPEDREGRGMFPFRIYFLGCADRADSVEGPFATLLKYTSVK